MDLSLIIFLTIVAYFIFKGYKNGIINVSSRVLSLFAAYLVAFFYAQPFSHWIQSNTTMQGLITYAVAGLLLFIATGLIVSYTFSKVTNKINKKTNPISKVSSVSGAIVGSLVGVLFGLIFVWFYSTILSVYQEKRGETIALPTKLQQATRNLASVTVKSAVYGVTKQHDLAEASAALLSNPAENMKRFKNLNQSQVMQKFLNNHLSQQALNSGNAQAVMIDPAFQKFVLQKDFVELSREFGFSNDKNEMHRQMAFKTTELWAKINKVKADPEYRQIVESPEIQQMVNTSDIYALMSNAKVERMLEIISETKISKVTFENITQQDGSALEATSSTQLQTRDNNIYRWVDDKGRVHYSDKEKEKEKEKDD